jgi:HD-like signal output (HDOD) protein
VLDADVIVAAIDKFHLQAGGLLAERWKLPVIVKECLLYHHDYRSAPTCMEAAMITCLADDLSYVAMNTERDETIVDEIRQHPVVSDLRLTPAQLDGLFAELDEAARVMEAMAIV